VHERIFNLGVIPLTVINVIGVIVSGIWLAFLGEWKAIGIGLGLVISSSLIFTIILIPGSVFKYLGGLVQEKGYTWTGFTIESVFSIYMSATVCITGYLCFYYYTSISTTETLIPLLIWSHGVATGIWGSLTYKALNANNNIVGVSTFIHALTLSIGYIYSMFIYHSSNYDINSIIPILVVSSSVGLILQLIFTAYSLYESKQDWL
jgi:hypothetical protein